MAETARAFSVVVPVYNEADNIVALLEQLSVQLMGEHETLLIYDKDDDTTLPPALAFSSLYPPLRLVKNRLGRGVLNALRTGFSEAKGDVVVVVMADLSDDLSQIPAMVGLAREGNAVVAASRYMQGGGQIGGPRLKRLLSRAAGLSLHFAARVATHDPTNNFKAYSRTFLETVQLESEKGFEVALELTTKAHLAGWPIVEIPTVWRDRTAGASRFPLARWLPAYTRWYLRCVTGTWFGDRSAAG